MPDKIVIQLSAEGAEAVARVFKDLAASAQKFNQDLTAGSREASTAFAAFGTSAKRVFEIFTGFSLANISAEIARMSKDAIVELTKMGLENQRVEESFTRMARAVGVSADALVASLRRASEGIVDSNAVMLSSSKALAQGLNADQLTTIMETARAQATLSGKTVAESFNAIAEAVTNLNARSLRDFGIVIDLQKAYESYAATLGKTAGVLTEAGQRAALMNAIDQQTLKNRQALTQGELTNAQQIEKARAVWSDFFATTSRGFATMYGDLVKNTAVGLTWYQNYRTWLEDLDARFTHFVLRGNLPKLPVPVTADEAAGIFGGRESPVPGVDLIDKTKDALLQVDTAMAKLAISNAAGVIGAQGYAAAIGQQVAKLQALGSTAPEVTSKILALQTQMATLTNNVAADITKMNEAIEVLAGLLNRVDIQLSKSDLSGAFNVTAVLQELTDLSDTLGALQVDTENEVKAARALAEAFEQLGPIQEALNKSFTGGPELTAELIAVNRELMALKANSDVDAESIRKFGLSFEGLTEAEQDLIRLNAQLKDAQAAKDYATAIQQIGVEAQLFGTAFDKTGATIAAMEQRLRSLAATSRGEVTPEMQALAEELRSLRDLKGLFDDVFESIGSSINAMVQGILQGTQTIAQAFQNLWKNLIVGFVNSGIQRLLKSAQDTVWNLVQGVAAASAAGATGVGAAGGLGTSDIGREGGQTGFSVPSTVNQFGGSAPTIAGFFDPARWTTISAVWDGLAAGWAEGTTVASSFTGALSQGASALSTAASSASALSVGVAGLAAAYSVYDNIMAGVNGRMGEFGLRLGLGVAGGVAGGVFGGPLGALAGVALGDFAGKMLSKLFGTGPSEGEIKRIQAADEANRALGRLTLGFEDALKTMNPATVLASLQAGAGGPAGNAVRTELVLPSSLAAEIGVTGEQIGDRVVAQWSSVTLAQFDKVIEAFKTQPGLIDLVRGSGDVTYLGAGDAASFADRIQNGARGLLTAFTEMEKIADQINEVADAMLDAIETFLPPDVGALFARQIDSIRDQMIDALKSGLPVEDIQRLVTDLEAKLKTYGGLAKLYATLDQDVAQITTDVGDLSANAVKNLLATMESANREVARATQRRAEAVTPDETLASASALREAILGRYALEMQLIQGIQENLATILSMQGEIQIGQTPSAVATLGQGDPSFFNEIYLAVAQLAMIAPTAAQRLSAIGRGIGLVLAAVPVTVRSLQPAGPRAIVDQIQTNLAPFFGALSDMIHDAVDAGDVEGQLDLLRQQAQAIQQVGAAQIAAVQAWQQAALGAATDAIAARKQDIRDAADAEIRAVQLTQKQTVDTLTGYVDAFNEAVASIQDGIAEQMTGLQDQQDALSDATEQAQAALADRIDGLTAERDAIQDNLAALQDHIRAVQEWEGVVESTGKLIESLKQGPTSPLNPRAQFDRAQDDLRAAMRAFRQAPTPTGAADVQRLAQTVLTAGARVFSEPAPKFQALFTSVIGQLKAVAGVAGAQAGPVSSKDLEAQVDRLTAASDALGDRIDALNQESQDIGRDAQRQAKDLARALKDLQKESTRIGNAAADHVDDLTRQITHANDLAQTQIDAINATATVETRIADADLEAMVNGINTAAGLETDRLNQGIAAALTTNADAQNLILGEQTSHQLGMLDVLNQLAGNEQQAGIRALAEYSARRQKEAVDLLLDIRDGLKNAIPEHAEGTMYTQAGLARLHAGEIVIPRTPSDLLRRGVGAPATGADRSAMTLTVNVNVAGVAGDDRAALAAVIRREVVPVIEREMRGGKLGAVTVERVRGT